MTAAPWTPDEASFFRPTGEGGYASVLVDLNALKVEPARSHPVLVRLRFALRHPTAEGLRDRDELGPATQLEEQLTAQMREAFDAWFVGHVIVDGAVILAYYGIPDPRGTWAPPPGPYAVEASADDDPGWAYLHEVLAPDEGERRQIATLRQLSALSELGDRPEAEREVDWTITVPSDRAAGRVARKLRKAGYRVAEPVTSTITATAVHALAVGELLGRGEQLSALAERHGGRLDGWGAPVTGAGDR